MYRRIENGIPWRFHLKALVLSELEGEEGERERGRTEKGLDGSLTRMEPDPPL